VVAIEGLFSPIIYFYISKESKKFVSALL